MLMMMTMVMTMMDDAYDADDDDNDVDDDEMHCTRASSLPTPPSNHPSIQSPLHPSIATRRADSVDALCISISPSAYPSACPLSTFAASKDDDADEDDDDDEDESEEEEG